MSNEPESEYLSLPEVAALLRMPPSTIRRWVDAGRIPTTTVGGELLFLRSDIEAVAIWTRYLEE